jgi:hypothetical protein
MSEEQELQDRVSQFQEQVRELKKRFDPKDADRVIAADMAATRQQHERNGFLMASSDTLFKYEHEQRAKLDRQLSSDGANAEIKRDVLIGDFKERIAAAQPLPSQAQKHGTSGQNFLLGQILDELQVGRVHQELKGLTRGQVLDKCSASKDETDNAFVRTVEAAVLSNDLERLGIVDDANAEADVLAIPKLKAAIEQRRKARVPEYLFKLQADV